MLCDRQKPIHGCPPSLPLMMLLCVLPSISIHFLVYSVKVKSAPVRVGIHTIIRCVNVAASQDTDIFTQSIPILLRWATTRRYPPLTKMSLTLAFPLADPLREALDKFKEPLATMRAVIVGIDNETLVLHGEPIEATENLTADLTAVRKVMPVDVPRFVMIKLEEKSFSEVMFVPEGTKPKVKMLYAGSSAHLREVSRLAIGTDIHVVSVDEINPTLFGRDIQAERAELRTEKEKIAQELATMEVAPQRSAIELPAGVQSPLNPAGIEAVLGIKDKKLRAATFKLDGGNTLLDKTAAYAEDDAAESWLKLLPEDEPRFAVINFKNDAIVLLYLCPDGCKPKVKMPYAATKASFVSQLTHLETKPKKSVETNSAKGADILIDEALNGAQLEDDAKPIAPKSVMPKGPRMLI